MTILISGGNGLIGKYLCKKLIEKGYVVAILSRTNNKDPYIQTYFWDPDKNEIENEALETADYIIHLAGANIGIKRWTAKRKKLITESRIKTGNLIFEKIKERRIKLKAFITASAVGYYGTITSDQIFRESDLASNDFLGKTCVQWEQITKKFEELGIRTTIIRTGVVLTKEGGALSKMIAPIKKGIGSAIGSGRQYIPWIHIDDLCGIYIKAIEDTEMKGAYNAVAPDLRTNKDFIRTLAHILRKPFWVFNVPAFMLKIIFGKMSDILLKGSRVSADKIKAAGYNFIFPELESALIDLVRKE
jgi:uncharacterized protein